MMLELLRNRKFTTYSVIILALLLFLVFFYSTLPAIQGLNAAQSELENKQKQLDEMKLQVENLQQFGEQDAFELAIVRKKIPENVYSDQIIRDLRSLEASTGLSFSNYQPVAAALPDSLKNKIANSAALSPLEMTFTFRAKRGQLLALLQEIEYLNRVYLVTGLNVTTDAKIPVALVDQNEGVNVSLTLQTYFVPSLQKYFRSPLPFDSI